MTEDTEGVVVPDEALDIRVIEVPGFTDDDGNIVPGRYGGRGGGDDGWGWGSISLYPCGQVPCGALLFIATGIGVIEK